MEDIGEVRAKKSGELFDGVVTKRVIPIKRGRLGRKAGNDERERTNLVCA